MIKAVIFDLDGVLLSTDEFHFQAWKKLADREGIEFSRQINERLRGVSREESLEIILEKTSRKYSTDEKLEMATCKNEIYKQLLEQLTPSDIFPGVMELLEFLKENNIKTAIGSSSKNTKFILGQTGLAKYFTGAVSDGTNINRSKPDPEVFLKAAEFIDVPPSECLVVEDADAGIMAAKAAGMTAIGIGPAAKHPETDIPAKNTSEIQSVITELICDCPMSA